ncbi:MAG TPA: hypothetical protein VER14_01970 [Phototrophicaceae bacterium]|nr:hypothetical protein [Phototrophicaceae bacterium]
MANMPIADPTTTDQPSAMSRAGKVNGSLSDAIMQAFHRLLLYNIQTFVSVSPFGVEDGCLVLAIPISYMAISSANKIIILWSPRKFILGELVEGFSVASGASYIVTVST